MSFVEEVRRAIQASPRASLGDVTKAMWGGFGAGLLTEGEAEELSALIEARKAVAAPPAASMRSVGSRPRSPASLERRRRWANSGHVPGTLACRFTVGETAVLSVIALEVAKRGDCRMTVGHIAAVAGVSETTAKRAIREAKARGIITVEERRLRAWRNDSNIVRVVDAAWIAWLRIGRGSGGHFANPTNNKDSSKGFRGVQRGGFRELQPPNPRSEPWKARKPNAVTKGSR